MVQALSIINACIDIILRYSGGSSTIRRCVKSKVAPRRHLLENGALANRATLQAERIFDKEVWFRRIPLCRCRS